jgi:hypothetical protein
VADVATLVELKAWLRYGSGNSDDSKLTDILHSASEWVEWKIGGPLAPTSFTEFAPVHGYAYIPQKRPLVSVTSITPDLGAALDSSRYQVDTTRNMIRFRWGVFAGWYTFVYTAGLASTTYRVKNAGLELCRHLWLTQNGSSGRGRSDDDIPVPMGFAVPRRVDELLATKSVAGFA